MARRVVRDIEKKGPKTISLREEPESKKISKQEKVLDVSKRKLRTGEKARALKDIESNKGEEKVMFFQVDSDESSRPDRLGESLRIAVAGVLILFVLNILNIYQKGLVLKDDLVSAAQAGYTELMHAGNEAANADFGSAELTFSEAQKYFKAAQESIAFLKVNEEYFFTREKTLQSVQGLFDAAQDIASAGKNFSRGIQNLEELPTLFIEENSDAETNEGKKSLTEKLKEDLVYVDAAIEDLASAEKNLKMVSKDVLPPSFREELSSAKSKIEKLNALLAKTRQKIPALLELMGDRYPHRYLILLQNDTEARPTGGFIGSYIIVDLNDGYLTKMDFHDVYELDGQLQEDIQPPSDIAIVSDNWRMRDSNYSPDFAISAEKAAWFLQKQRGPSVDSIIAINQSFISDLLQLTGPIQLGALDAPLDGENFQLILSFVVESKLSGVETPKAIIAELVPVFQKKLLQEATLEEILMTLIGGIKDEKILFYSRNEKVQELFDELNMTKRTLITAPDEDYMNVTVTSVGGNKSDRYIDQKIRHHSIIHPDGTIVNEVTITRRHDWSLKDLDEWRSMMKKFGFGDLPPHIQYILGAGPNKAFVKLYVPKGSELVNTEGFEVEKVLQEDDEEIQKTYFMVQMDTEAGKETSVTIAYQLPYKLGFFPADAYKFHAQKQPAINSSYFQKTVFLKPGVDTYRQYPGTFIKSDGGYIEYGGVLNGDLYLSTLVGT